ncbi:hypothetical protein HIM_09984 [Hirsutella minnesotensis 3608]|uniref:Protein kinase domain-containing protein n=1 Tax=Hirsutella minnesotensis 3608 TaxID=1043627 RepID=A0A0F8A2Q5_9HYPO|nr:hypothetical protein HIM_09984 [Hirsutella minnesotensis 3608]
MEVYQQAQVFIEKDGDLEFGFTKLIIRGLNHQYFYAITKDRIGASSSVDLDRLQKIPISIDSIWPRFSVQFSRAPEPLPSECFVKEPNLLDYGDTPASLQLSSHILHEVEVCEILKKNPHPNIATYMGCVVAANRIQGLCFVRYKMTLAKRLSLNAPFNKDLCLQDMEQGIQHLHSLGFVHNDINPMNVMVDEMDRAIIIDFDSCQQVGHKLGLKAGTHGWSTQELEYARFDNDFIGLSRLREYMYT